MGKTRRRDPMARELSKPQYRQRKKKDKRKARLEELMNEPLMIEEKLNEFRNVICFHCRNTYDICQCPQPVVVTEDENNDRPVAHDRGQ